MARSGCPILTGPTQSGSPRFVGFTAHGAPQWSPDGKLITFHSIRDGQGEVYLIPAAGGTPRISPRTRPAMGSPVFLGTASGSISARTGRAEYQIWKMPVSGGEPFQVTNNGGRRALESPDGTCLYYVETMSNPSPLWCLPSSGAAPAKLLEGVVLGAFAVHTKGIYYIDRPSGETRLQYFDLAARRSTTVSANLGNIGPFLTTSPDGRTILYNRMDSSVDDLMLVENFR